MNKQRIVILDYNHQLHQYMNSKAPRLFYNQSLGAQAVTIETTIPNYTIKAMHNYARRGQDIMAVCFDSPCQFRKNYFMEKKDGTPTDIEYKGGRKSMPKPMLEGSALTIEMLSKAEMPIYKVENYEADDLIYSLVMVCKELYPSTAIDIITNDADLLPLVDEQVSVFFRNRKFTWAIDKSLLKRNYWQVIPDNYSTVVEGLSKYVKFSIPYNTLLLHKLLRGDDSDNIPGSKNPFTNRADFPPKMFNELIDILECENLDLQNMFRYADFKPRKELSQLTEGVKLSNIYEKRVMEQLDKLCEILSVYVDDYTIEHIRFIYMGMNLRFINLVPPVKYDVGKLRVELSRLGIQLPI